MPKKKASFEKSKVHGPPEGQPWCWISRDLIESPAWRARTIHCARLIEFLMHEHMSHGGMENGQLVAPYAQLVAWGIGRRYIKDAIREAEGLRLVVAQHGGRRAHTKAAMTRFRLTFYHTRESASGLHPYWVAPGDEWRTVTAEIARRVLDARAPRNARKKNASAHGGPGVGNTVETLPVHTVELPPETKPPKYAIFADDGVVTPCAPLSISREGERRTEVQFSACLNSLDVTPSPHPMLPALGHPLADSEQQNRPSSRKRRARLRGGGAARLQIVH
jgi:hypothetical protein